MLRVNAFNQCVAGNFCLPRFCHNQWATERIVYGSIMHIHCTLVFLN